jgi:hypothetical protein
MQHTLLFKIQGYVHLLVQGYSEFLMENNSSPKSGTGFLKTCFNGVNALSGL